MTTRTFNRIALLGIALLVFSVIDSCTAAFGTPYVFRMTPGDTVLVSGDLLDTPAIPNRWLEEPSLETIRSHVDFTRETPGLHIDFIELRGRLWRGYLQIDSVTPGQYTFQVFNTASKEPEVEPLYTVRVFADRDALRADMPSISERYLDIRPVLIFFMAMPLTMLLLYLSFRQSGKDEALLISQGIGSVYKLAKSKIGWDVMVGLGSDHGVNPGDTLRILDRKMHEVGELKVETVGPEASGGLLPLDANIKSGYYVALPGAVVPEMNRP
ncbi:hypothetical protein GKC30_08160 [Pseudodesulfovibrio sp. F-1]|uniref:Uncharacterized protein n=1 Tax=Pseudodesulfovibrio alkaliphilus TaxID=2661613 RepID=A0A7K1KNF0_9BACT|nr:hypothetical protein [Pseudodesulfovibrio alkaliphilus]MUM77603.1 hypothetical protein [Pseudodesulfovibrio alkaliphilus]